MNDILTFLNREEFRKWLSVNCLSSNGVWLLFGKSGGPKTITSSDALEEALCFGWIDGQMKSIDNKTYKKYFALRRGNSKWSEKNKALAAHLEQQGIMTNYGRAKIEEAKQNGQWSMEKPVPISEDQISLVAASLKKFEPAYSNFMAMSPSVKKTYARAYMDAKTDAGHAKRLSWMVDRLNKNLKPM